MPPERVLDLRALVGDPSDNIPGVKGIGEKGAAKLIAEWGDLESLLAHAAEVPAKRAREALLEQARAGAPLEAPRDAAATTSRCRSRGLEAARARSPIASACARCSERLGFTRLARRRSTTALRRPRRRGRARGARPSRSTRRSTPRRCATPRLSSGSRGAARRRRASSLALVGAGERIACATPVGPRVRARAGRAPPTCRSGTRGLASHPQLAREAVVEALGAADASSRAGAASRHQAACRCCSRSGAASSRVADASTSSSRRSCSIRRRRAASTALAAQHLGRRAAAAGRSWRVAARRRLAREPSSPIDAVAAWAGEQVCAVARARAAARAAARARRARRALRRRRAAARRACSRAWSARACASTRPRSRELSREYEARARAHRGARSTRSPASAFQIASPKQLQQLLFEKLKLPVVQQDQDRLLDRRGRARAARVAARAAGAHPRVPPARQAQEHLRRRAAAARRIRAPAASIRPSTSSAPRPGGSRRRNPNVQNIPIRTEEGVRIREAFVPARGRRAALGRLLAGRAAHPRALLAATRA